MNFVGLVAQITGIDGTARLLSSQTLHQVLSLRNWLIGASIVEFEQAGEDRARYGQRLMTRLAAALSGAGCRGASSRNLKNFRQVTLAYPGLDVESFKLRLAFPRLSSRQASAESGHVRGNQQTSAEFALGPFPSIARRVTERQQQEERARIEHARDQGDAED